MNSNLYNKTIELPKEIMEYLETCFEHIPNSDTSIEGHKRNEELRNLRSSNRGKITEAKLKERLVKEC